MAGGGEGGVGWGGVEGGGMLVMLLPVGTLTNWISCSFVKLFVFRAFSFFLSLFLLLPSFASPRI